MLTQVATFCQPGANRTLLGGYPDVTWGLSGRPWRGKYTHLLGTLALLSPGSGTKLERTSLSTGRLKGPADDGYSFSRHGLRIPAANWRVTYPTGTSELPPFRGSRLEKASYHSRCFISSLVTMRSGSVVQRYRTYLIRYVGPRRTVQKVRAMGRKGRIPAKFFLDSL